MITEVKITNFVSIKDEIWSDLHPGHNVIGGANGSGKSSFLRAIRFVLTNHFPCITVAEKLSILNDSKNFARVDIIIDNEDIILSINTKVRLSRKIDMKKDLYFINDRRIEKSDFFKILEKANFSVKYPLYIVPQGQERSLALISNEERLKILEEFSGVGKFKEQQRQILYNENQQKSTIDIMRGTLDNLDEKLDYLKEDINELKEYDRLKEEIDTIKTIVSNRKLEKIEKDLEDWEQKGNENREKINNLKNDFHVMEEKEQELLNSMKNVKNSLKKLEKMKKKLIELETGNKTKKDELEYECADMEKELEMLEEEKDLEADLKMNEQIAELENNLATLLPMYEKEAEELEKLRTKLAFKEEEIQGIYARNGRGREFSSMFEKDEWLKIEVSKLQTEVQKSESEVEKLEEQIPMDEDTKTVLEKEIKTLEGYINSQESTIKSDTKTLEDLIQKKTQSSEKLSTLRDQEIENDRELSKIQSEFDQVDGKFRKLVPKNILSGMKSVKKILEVLREREESTEGFFGLLLDLFRIKRDSFKVAVENAAGNRLFNFVAATDELAIKIIEEMNKFDLPGVVNFLPLDRMRVLELKNIPEKTFCILNILEYEAEHGGAIRDVFGRKLVCENLDAAYQFAKTLKVDCITLEGDQAFSNGNLSGGYQDLSQLRLDLYQQRMKLEIQAEALQERQEFIRSQIKEENETLMGIENEILRIGAKLKLSGDNCAKMKIDLETINLKLTSLLEVLVQERKKKEAQMSRIKILQLKISNFEQDLCQELSSQLSEEEKRHLQSLLKEKNSLHRTILQKEKTVVSLKFDKEHAENMLTIVQRQDGEQIRKAKEDLTLRKETLKKDIGSKKSEIILLIDKTFETELRDIKSKLDYQNQKKTRIEIQLEEVNPEKEKLEKKLKIINNLTSKIDFNIKNLEKKKSLVEEEICNVTFSETVGRDFEKLPSETLEKRLEKSKKILRKMKVNPRAKEIQKEIRNFKEPIDTDLESMNLSEDFEEFLTEADEMAAKVLEEEFRELSKNFDRVFKKFVPEGRGELRKCRADSEVEDEIFTGIDLAVSFSGRGIENLNSLSGGQKAIVSLALIFANSVNNPPPFFIFDEVDAPLSEWNVGILIQIINEITSTTQVLTSTFNRRIMEQGDKFYRVISINNSAHIESVDSVEGLLLQS